jgi:hypothetical protein
MSDASRANLRRGNAALPCLEPIQAEEPCGVGVPQQLRDMRHVYERPASEDRTPGQRTCRRWKNENLSGFMAHKSSLEAKVLVAQSKKPEPPESGDDEPLEEGPQSRKNRERTQEILAHLREKEAAENARLACEPQAAREGADLQRQLRESLERRDWLTARIKELEGDGDDSREARVQGIFDEIFERMGAPSRELASRPNPAEAIASLRRELKSSRDREESLHQRLERLHGHEPAEPASTS